MEQQFLSAFAPPKVYQPVPKPSPENLVSSTAEVLLPTAQRDTSNYGFEDFRPCRSDPRCTRAGQRGVVVKDGES